MSLPGTTVTVDGPFTDADEVKFKESYEAFEEATGITVNYVGNKEFEGHDLDPRGCGRRPGYR